MISPEVPLVIAIVLFVAALIYFVYGLSKIDER